MGKLATVLGPKVYLDTNIVIYAIEGFEQYRTILWDLLKAIDDSRITAATSVLTLAEVLVKPMIMQNHDLQLAYKEFLRPNSLLEVIDIDQSIVEQAARIRAKEGVKLADAIHLATCLEANCSTFLTNDTILSRVKSPNVLVISELLNTWPK